MKYILVIIILFSFGAALFLFCDEETDQYSDQYSEHKFEFLNIFSFDVAGSGPFHGDDRDWQLHSATRILLLDYASSDDLVTNKFDDTSREFTLSLIKKTFTEDEYIEFCQKHLGNIDEIEIQGDSTKVAFLIENEKTRLVVKMPKEGILEATKDEVSAKNQVNILVREFANNCFN